MVQDLAHGGARAECDPAAGDTDAAQGLDLAEPDQLRRGRAPRPQIDDHVGAAGERLRRAVALGERGQRRVQGLGDDQFEVRVHVQTSQPPSTVSS